MIQRVVKHIIITNIVVLNGGDGAILFGMIKTLRQAFGEECKISVYASHPEIANQMYPEIDFRETLGLAATRCSFSHIRYLGRICRTLQQARYMTVAWCLKRKIRFPLVLLPNLQRKYLQEYSSADLVVSCGGTYLKEEYGVRTQVSDYRLTQILNRPLAFFTQTLGPFNRDQTRRILRSIFDKSLCILLRDEQSRESIRELGVTRVPIHLAADAAFALANPLIVEKAKSRSVIKSPIIRVAVSVRYWSHFSTCSNEEGMARFRRSVAEAVSQLIREGAEVTFISTCQGIAEYADDSSEARKVIGFLDADTASQIHIVDNFVRFDEMMNRLQEFDLCIGTRMHMCILSLISGTPALPIAYEFKTKELFNSLGLGDWVTDIEEITPAGFVELMLDFKLAIPTLSDELFGNVMAAHRSSLQAGSLIAHAHNTMSSGS